jgi:GNAT superfamily N-acetyltransferase
MTAAVHYRMARPTDVAALAQMNYQLIRDEGHRNGMSPVELETRMRGWLDGEYEAVVFENDVEPVGYALYRREPDHVYLRQFFVLSAYRRQGIGRASLAWLRTRCWANASRVHLDVLVGNQTAHDFWRSVGFTDYCLTMEWSK